MIKKPTNEELAQEYARKESGLWCDSPWFNLGHPYDVMFDRIMMEQAKAFKAGLEKQDE